MKKHITRVNQIEKKEFHYIYNNGKFDIHFLYKPVEKSEGIAVVFHGAKNLITSLPIFRCYNYDLKKYSILCFSDPILHLYNKYSLQLSWFLDTKKYKFTNDIVSIIKKIKDIENHNNLLFLGTSGGGFPSIKYGAIFKQKVLVSNAQFYLNLYPYYKRLNNILSEEEDSIEESISINEIIIKYGTPKQLWLYCNKYDTDHIERHAIPFRTFLEQNNYTDILKWRAFKGGEVPEGETTHSVRFPKGCYFDKLIQRILAN